MAFDFTPTACGENHHFTPLEALFFLWLIPGPHTFKGLARAWGWSRYKVKKFMEIYPPGSPELTMAIYRFFTPWFSSYIDFLDHLHRVNLPTEMPVNLPPEIPQNLPFGASPPLQVVSIKPSLLADHTAFASNTIAPSLLDEGTTIPGNTIAQKRQGGIIPLK